MRHPLPRLRSRALAALVVTLLASPGATVPRAAAQEPGPGVDEVLVPPPPFGGEDDLLAAALVDVPVGGGEFAAALAQHQATEQALLDAQQRLLGQRARLASLLDVDRRLGAHLRGARAREREALAALQRHRRAIRALAIDAFTHGDGDATELLDPELANRAARRRGLAATVRGTELAALSHAEVVLADARDEAALAVERRRSVRSEQIRTAGERDELQQTSFALAVELAAQRVELQRTRAVSPVRGLDLSMVALDAYVRAASSIEATRPGCRLSWTVLAGIGRVESRHGTYRGAEIGPDGVTSPPIIGVALSGGDGVALVGDTDGGRWDGDAVHDRAVGPMQFIPSSWVIYGQDGDGDELEDPNNLYDAALAAADHLCRRHRGLDDLVVLRAALLGYNRSEAYGARVVELAQGYAAARVRLR